MAQDVAVRIEEIEDRIGKLEQELGRRAAARSGSRRCSATGTA